MGLSQGKPRSHNKNAQTLSLARISNSGSPLPDDDLSQTSIINDSLFVSFSFSAAATSAPHVKFAMRERSFRGRVACRCGGA